MIDPDTDRSAFWEALYEVAGWCLIIGFTAAVAYVAVT